jgi:hypothetical protein
VLYDVSTLHIETDAGDGFRGPGFSKERRLDNWTSLIFIVGISPLRSVVRKLFHKKC